MFNYIFLLLSCLLGLFHFKKSIYLTLEDPCMLMLGYNNMAARALLYLPSAHSH